MLEVLRKVGSLESVIENGELPIAEEFM